jgi:plastocyanin
VIHVEEKPMRIAMIVVAFAFVACGGGGGGGGGGPTEAPVHITATGFNNSSITIPSGGRVHFFNDDTKSHQVTSNCTELNTQPIPAGGNSLQPTMTGPLSCNYSDTANAALAGSVSVSAPGTGGGGAGY